MFFLIVLSFFSLALPVTAQQSCFTAETRANAERTAKVYREPNPDYDPVLGYNRNTGPRKSAPPVDSSGLARPFTVSQTGTEPGRGTTPKFHCSVPGITNDNGDLVRYKVKPHFKGQSRDKRNGEVYGEFLSSRFSKALGFFADDEWVSDVTCADCENSLTKGFQGPSFQPFQPAAGIELPLGNGIDVTAITKTPDRSQDRFRSWFKAELPARRSMRSSFGWHSSTMAIPKPTTTSSPVLSRRRTATHAYASRDSLCSTSVTWIDLWLLERQRKKSNARDVAGKDPIKVSGGHCTTTAKSVGDTSISEEGRQLLARGLQRLLDEEQTDGTITRVFRASRNAERDRPPEEWTAEFQRKASMIINARCSTDYSNYDAKQERASGKFNRRGLACN